MQTLFQGLWYREAWNGSAMTIWQDQKHFLLEVSLFACLSEVHNLTVGFSVILFARATRGLLPRGGYSWQPPCVCRTSVRLLAGTGVSVAVGLPARRQRRLALQHRHARNILQQSLDLTPLGAALWQLAGRSVQKGHLHRSRGAPSVLAEKLVINWL